MHIDWINFTPWKSLVGGLMIGAASALLLLFNGRIAGISGILGGLLRLPKDDMAWRIAFLSGLVTAPAVYGFFFPIPAPHGTDGGFIVLIAGLLVGLGTRYGSGCTSGHGVCGLSRRSPRSIVATAAFMIAGFVTVYVIHHLAGIRR